MHELRISVNSSNLHVCILASAKHPEPCNGEGCLNSPLPM